MRLSEVSNLTHLFDIHEDRHESSNAHLCLGPRRTNAVIGCTNQANIICAFAPKAQMRVAIFVFGLYVCRTNASMMLACNSRGLKLSTLKDGFIRK